MTRPLSQIILYLTKCGIGHKYCGETGTENAERGRTYSERLALFFSDAGKVECTRAFRTFNSETNIDIPL